MLTADEFLTDNRDRPSIRFRIGITGGVYVLLNLPGW